MARLLWGEVFFREDRAGILREEPNGAVSFAYDTDYIAAGKPKIAHSLPVQADPYINPRGLHPFFDNLVSEGWLEQAQTRLLGKRAVSRTELLLAFGFDCAGAVWVKDTKPSPLTDAMLDLNDPKEIAARTGRASLSGVQPKLALMEKDSIFYPSHINGLSTHIAKFPSGTHADLIENEYLTMTAFKALLPDDTISEFDISAIEGFDEPALVIKRFDRSNNKRLHFEEFNQLLAKPSEEKYDGAHKEMSHFIRNTPGCAPVENYLVFRRILAGFILGNTDMHLKNFAMFHTGAGYRLTPSYDQVAAALYPYKTIALETGGAANLPIGSLKARHIVLLGEEFGLSHDVIETAVITLRERLENAKEAVFSTAFGAQYLKESLITFTEKRWNGTFSLIGKALSKKR